MHPEYIQYAHHLGIGDGTLILFPNDPLYAFALIHPKNAANAQQSQPAIEDTQDIDYEIVEPIKLPPSNTQDNV